MQTGMANDVLESAEVDSEDIVGDKLELVQREHLPLTGRRRSRVRR